MQATVVILFLASCGIASANLFEDVQRQSTNCGQIVIPTSILSGCTGTNPCADSCAGAICDYWNSQGAQECSSDLGQGCENQELNVPSACTSSSGALALVTIKGVLVAVLLLAVFFIL